MGIHQGIAAPSGGLSLQKIYKKGTRVAAPWQWQVKNRLRTGYIWGYLTVKAAELFSKITGLPVVTSSLRLVVI